MDYEKKYNEALERARKLYEQGTITESLCYVFPELKESKDEKIRACIGMCLTDIDEQRFADFNTNLKECRDWLEKQGEQKETLCDKCKKIQPSHSCQDITALGRCALEKQGEQKLTEFERAVKQVMEEAIECGDTRNLKADAEMLLSLVHKPAWSEEDKDFMYDTLSNLTELKDRYGEGYGNVGKCIDWLRTLKPQSTWKPSDEQIEALEHFIVYHNGSTNYAKDLEELRLQLKTLKGE